MLDLSNYQSLGAALKDALETFSAEICLIEADRDRENHRLTYSEFKKAALPLASFLQSRGVVSDSRTAIIMTNQSRWLIAAYAVFHSGGVLVPLDYKLTASEQIALLKHSRSSVLVTEYHIWRLIAAAQEFGQFDVAECHDHSKDHSRFNKEYSPPMHYCLPLLPKPAIRGYGPAFTPEILRVGAVKVNKPVGEILPLVHFCQQSHFLWANGCDRRYASCRALRTFESLDVSS